MAEKAPDSCTGCTEHDKKILPMMDTLDVLNGRWKLVIISTLWFSGKTRFNQIRKQIPRITGKVLSKELKHLEEHLIINRTVKDTSPITVEYELTDYGKTLEPVIKALINWGIEHRSRMIV